MITTSTALDFAVNSQDVKYGQADFKNSDGTAGKLYYSHINDRWRMFLKYDDTRAVTVNVSDSSLKSHGQEIYSVLKSYKLLSKQYCNN